jgi:hypothetical protein
MKRSYYRKLTFFALLLSCFCHLHNAFSQDHPFLQNLKAYFKFDGDLNSTYPEISGSASATLSTDRFGNQNSALQFDGVDDTFSFSIDEILWNDFTISVWAKSTKTTTVASESTSGMSMHNADPKSCLLSVAHGGSNRTYGFNIGTNGLNVTHYADFLVTSSLAHTSDLSEWKHYTFISDSNKAKLYIDGSFVKNGLQMSNLYCGSSFLFGRSRPLPNQEFYKGDIDDLYIYDRVLLSSEVLTLYNSAPQSLNSVASLSISENQATGTVVGEFNATDPDGDPITYALVSGAGDTNNALFILESNGTLKTATVLDHEQNPGPLSVRVQVKDDYNATTEGNFSVTIIDTVDFTIVLNVENNGSVTGGGQYDEGASVNLAATPGLGYLFNGWSGGFVSGNANETITVSDNYTITATFAQDIGDTDDDGLSNYYELAILGTNPESADTDGDGFSDLDENSTGLDPTVANSALYNFQAGRENTARSDGNATGYQAGLAEGNASGIAWVQQNLSAYSLVSEADKNATDLSNYLGGISDGNISGINFVRNHPATYGLFSEEEKNASDARAYTTGFADGNTSGYTTGFSIGQSDGISLVRNSPAVYQLLTLEHKQTSDAQSFDLGYEDGTTAGYAGGLVDGNLSGVAWLQNHAEELGFYTAEHQTSTVQTSQTEGVANAQNELSKDGLSSLTYFEYVRRVSTLYLQNWHYQEGLGWLWTNKKTFPFVYRMEKESQPAGWLYFSPLPEQASAPFYDYLRKEWVGRINYGQK